MAPRLPALAIASLAVCLAGCGAPLPGLQPTAPAAQGGNAAVASGQALLEPRYLRFKGEDIGLVGAQDDGRYTYLEFSSPVRSPAGAAMPADVEIFDQDGKGLEIASADRVVAVRGVHPGILVRRQSLASFVSLNPRAAASARPPLVETAAHAEVRARLDNQDGQLQAMQRALEAARAAVASSAGRDPAARAGPSTPPSDAGTPSVQPATPHQRPRAPGYPGRLSHVLAQEPVQELAARTPDVGLPEVVYAASLPSAAPGLQAPRWPADPTPRRMLMPPLAAANASAAAPERGLVRIFFASASRAIVAPEDGLALLLSEVANADEIRVTGFTDATGSRAANDVLAQARADAVVQILLRRGIPASRIFSSAVGADEYIADNASERGRALNRRVEVLLLRNRLPMPLGGQPQAMK